MKRHVFKYYLYPQIAFLSLRLIYYSPYCSLSSYSNCTRIGESNNTTQFETISGLSSENSTLSLCSGNSGFVNKSFKISSILTISALLCLKTLEFVHFSFTFSLMSVWHLINIYFIDIVT